MRPTPHRLNLAAVAAVHTGLRVWTFLASDNGIDFHHNAYDRGLFVTRWLAHFTPVPDVAYGPVSFYLDAGAMAMIGDPVLATRLLSLVCAILLIVPTYALTRRLFGDTAALGATALAAVHPHAMRMGAVGLEMAPYALILLTAFWALARYDSAARRWPWALVAGLLFTMAAGTRFDAWVVLPVVGVAALWRDWKNGVLFCLAAALFPAVWMAYNLKLYGDPVHFLTIAGNIAGVHMHALSIPERLLGWPKILARYAPWPTLLFALAAVPLAWRVKATRPLLAAWTLTFAVFEIQTARAAMGWNETKYVMPLVAMMIPQAGAAVEAAWNRKGTLRAAAVLMVIAAAAWGVKVTAEDNVRFAAPKGARQQARFIAELPRDGRVVIGTSLQGYLLVHGKLLGGRALLPYPEDTTGRISADKLASYFRDPETKYLAYHYEDPVDFAPVLELPRDAGVTPWRDFRLVRLFLSDDRQFAVYRVEAPPTDGEAREIPPGFEPPVGP
ncbi:MAG: glycosyltransferase family 39 protein [Deltaproteobacteria bacterium]|nr:glycosyltransferase family 39 protein [Deltaproteobacteria bacterium]